MQDKSEFFRNLADDCKTEIVRYLPTSSLFKLSMASKKEYTLFKPLIDERKLINQLLVFVVTGAHDKVVSMLNKDISLLYQHGPVIDYSQREFLGDYEISPFKYVLWALDKHMWSTMLDCLPKDDDKANEILKILRSQYDSLVKNGITYQLNGKTVVESHFDFENTLIKELNMLNDWINATTSQDSDAIEKQWREGVGRSQQLAPIHVVHEYCSENPFAPLPQFTSKPKCSIQFFNWNTEMYEDWFSCDSQLGLDFAISKGGKRGASGFNGLDRLSVEVDLAAIKALYAIRKNDFIELKLQLEPSQTVENDPQPAQVANLSTPYGQ